jgi:hypothetical protein
MQKMQVLFPEPVFRRLRALAVEQDRPVSELVRRAVDRMLDQIPDTISPSPEFPVFRGGGVLVSAEDLKAVLYGDE